MIESLRLRTITASERLAAVNDPVLALLALGIPVRWDLFNQTCTALVPDPDSAAEPPGYETWYCSPPLQERPRAVWSQPTDHTKDVMFRTTGQLWDPGQKRWRKLIP